MPRVPRVHGKVKRLILLFAIVILTAPHAVWTQSGGRVLNARLRKSYPNLTQAFADPALQPGDSLLVVGTITEPGPVIIPSGWSGLIIGSTGWPATIRQQAPGTCDPNWGGGVNCMLDARQRGGLVRIVRLRFLVPANTTGIQAIGGGGLGSPQPLTISACRFQGVTPTTPFTGIVVRSGTAAGGPIVIEKNVITGTISSVGIALVGDDTNTVNARIRFNVISISQATGSPGVGIGLTGIPAGSTVLVERNRISGGGSAAAATAGIALAPDSTIPTTIGARGAIVRRNTICNFSDTSSIFNPLLPGNGIAFAASQGAQVQANVLRDNCIGVNADPSGFPASTPPPPPSVNDNNITAGSTICGGAPVGLNFGAGTYTLNAENNFWGAPSGPSGTGCPGTGLGVLPACGAAAGQVDVTPFRAASNPAAGGGPCP